MLLPTELLTVLFLASTAAHAFPQRALPANATSVIIDPPTPLSDLPPPPTETDIDIVGINDDSCITASCIPLQLIPNLPTATGFVDDTPLQPTDFLPQSQPDQVITTRRPTVIKVETSTAPTITPDGSDNQINVVSPEAPLPTNRPGAGNAPVNSVQPPQPGASNSLLNNIISKLGDARPEAQPTPPLAPATDIGSYSVPAMAKVTPGPNPSGGTGVAVPQETATVGGTITLGSAKVTLTPGLSTTVGSNGDATFIAITTNAAGQTLITLSSSGTAITATITDAPATITLPKTGFEASLTEVARPGALSTSSARGAAASASSKGAAAHMGAELGWWGSAILGIVGAGIVL